MGCESQACQRSELPDSATKDWSWPKGLPLQTSGSHWIRTCQEHRFKAPQIAIRHSIAPTATAQYSLSHFWPDLEDTLHVSVLIPVNYLDELQKLDHILYS